MISQYILVLLWKRLPHDEKPQCPTHFECYKDEKGFTSDEIDEFFYLKHIMVSRTLYCQKIVRILNCLNYFLADSSLFHPHIILIDFFYFEDFIKDEFIWLGCFDSKPKQVERWNKNNADVKIYWKNDVCWCLEHHRTTRFQVITFLINIFSILRLKNN